VRVRGTRLLAEKMSDKNLEQLININFCVKVGKVLVKRYCEVFRKMIFKTVFGSGTIVSQSA
jgi:hypothetical protein